MTRRSKAENRSTMLDLWRPPLGAGDPIGCFATTYTFQPSLFDEQCLARFLGIESDPNREDTAFLLEREQRLGSIYAGVLVDYTQAGVEHSLRWDVLDARVPRGKQHAKLGLLAWAGCVRVIVSSANLTEPGYRLNFEVASSVDFRAEECDAPLLSSMLSFLGDLLSFVPAGEERPDVGRARTFLSRVRSMSQEWKGPPRSRTIRHALACTMPSRAQAARSALGELIEACRSRGASPHEVWVASPFFDVDANRNLAAEALCDQMSRNCQRRVSFCVPGTKGSTRAAAPRLDAPRSLPETAREAGANVTVKLVPAAEGTDTRPWHAKMIHCVGDRYSALLVGSSNFTGAGLGLIPARNAEANLVTLVEYLQHGREQGLLERVWANMETVPDPTKAEWNGPLVDKDDDAAAKPLPAGFMAASYQGGAPRQLIIRLVPADVPPEWSIDAVGRAASACNGRSTPILRSHEWRQQGMPPTVTIGWAPAEPPEMLRVTWGADTAFLPLNVVDAGALPPPPVLRDMTADEMLAIIAASDPGAALRAWERLRRNGAPDGFDPDLDSASPGHLDPLNRYSLATTFLHRVRRRARVMAQMRRAIERPAISVQALEWRLRGLIGIEQLASRFAAEFEAASTAASSPADPREALLTLADLLIVLGGATYVGEEGALPKSQFERIFRPFLRHLANQLDAAVGGRRGELPADLTAFWDRTVQECRE